MAREHMRAGRAVAAVLLCLAVAASRASAQQTAAAPLSSSSAQQQAAPPAGGASASSATGAAWAQPPAQVPLYAAAPAGSVTASSTSDAKRYGAAAGMDGNNGTAWISLPVTASAPAWLQRDYGASSGAVIVAFRMGSWIDPRQVAAQSPADFKLQNSADGSTWTDAAVFTNQPTWSLAEDRLYLVPRPAGGFVQQRFYRLLVTRVPGNGSGVALRELRFITDSEFPAACTGLDAVSVGMNVMAGPPPSQDAPVPYTELSVLPAISNAGNGSVNLLGLRVPTVFSRRVRTLDGTWVIAPPGDFNITCLGGNVVGAVPLYMDLCPYLNITVTDGGVELEFAAAVVLCPGCTFLGTGSDPLFLLQHKDGLTLDRESLAVGALTCGDHNVTLQAVEMSDPEVMLTPEEAKQHPACVAWELGGGPPPLPSAAALASIKGSFFTQLIISPDSLPPGAASNATAVTALIGAAAAWPSEIRLKATITNTGRAPVSLSGVRFPLRFSGNVLVPTFNRWVKAGADEWLVSCWWGQVNQLGGARVPGDGNACKYMKLNVTSNGMELVFLGGQLCSGCSLVGNTDGIMFSVKHESYLQMDADVSTLQPLGPAAAAPLAAPPSFCGISGYKTAPARPALCPKPADIAVAFALDPFPKADPTDPASAASANTEVRIRPVIANAGSKPLPLTLLSIPINFNFNVLAGDSWMTRPPEEFNFTCWFGQVQGPGSDYANVCNSALMTATQSGFDLAFQSGSILPGDTLVGGSDNVLGTLNHVYYIPMDVASMNATAAVCTDSNTNATTLYPVQPGLPNPQAWLGGAGAAAPSVSGAAAPGLASAYPQVNQALPMFGAAAPGAMPANTKQPAGAALQQPANQLPQVQMHAPARTQPLPPAKRPLQG